MYSISILRQKAKKAGYSIEKGFQHYTVSGGIFTNMWGERFTGYMVKDLATNEYVWGSYDACYTHLWQLEDVEEFLKSTYEKYDMEW